MCSYQTLVMLFPFIIAITCNKNHSAPRFIKLCFPSGSNNDFMIEIDPQYLKALAFIYKKVKPQKCM